jgi:hypothetical protein
MLHVLLSGLKALCHLSARFSFWHWPHEVFEFIGATSSVWCAPGIWLAHWFHLCLAGPQRSSRERPVGKLPQVWKAPLEYFFGLVLGFQKLLLFFGGKAFRGTFCEPGTDRQVCLLVHE